MRLATILRGRQQRVVVEPHGRSHARRRGERAIERNGDPAVNTALDRHHSDLGVLRIRRRVVEADEGNGASVGRDRRREVLPGLLCQRPHLAVQWDDVQVGAQVAVPRVMALCRRHDRRRIGEPTHAVVLERAGRQIADGAGAVGGDDVDVLGAVDDPPFVVEAAEEPLDLAWRLRALVLGLVAGVTRATREGEPVSVRGPRHVGDTVRAAWRRCAPRRGRRRGARGAWSRDPSRRDGT